MQQAMTEAEVRQSSQNKIDKVQALCKELQVEIEAKQRLNPGSMFLENIVVFKDMEEYPLAKVERGSEAGPAEGTVIPENKQPDGEPTNENVETSQQ